MTRATTVGLALGCVLIAVPALAHHPPSILATVRITQPGQSEDAGQRVEMVSEGRVVARDVAEVMPAPPRPVGTSGAAGRAHASNA